MSSAREYLAGKFWVPCEKCGGTTKAIIGTNYPCGKCLGSGRRYPLRVGCPSCHGVGEIQHMTHEIPPSPCNLCGGLSFIFNDSSDALWGAVWAKGWDLTLYVTVGYPERIQIGNGKGLGKIIGTVREKDKLRGQTALETALARAGGWEGE